VAPEVVLQGSAATGGSLAVVVVVKVTVTTIDLPVGVSGMGTWLGCCAWRQPWEICNASPLDIFCSSLQVQVGEREHWVIGSLVFLIWLLSLLVSEALIFLVLASYMNKGILTRQRFFRKKKVRFLIAFHIV
jgi:hypothetical protein